MVLHNETPIPFWSWGRMPCFLTLNWPKTHTVFVLPVWGFFLPLRVARNGGNVTKYMIWNQIQEKFPEISFIFFSNSSLGKQQILWGDFLYGGKLFSVCEWWYISREERTTRRYLLRVKNTARSTIEASRVCNGLKHGSLALLFCSCFWWQMLPLFSKCCI